MQLIPKNKKLVHVTLLLVFGVSLSVGFAVYKYFDIPSSEDFGKIILKVGKTIADIDAVDIGSLNQSGPINYNASNIRFKRKGKTILSIAELSFFTFISSPLYGEMYYQGVATLEKGGKIKFLAKIPLDQSRPLLKAQISSLEVHIVGIAINTFLNIISPKKIDSVPVDIINGDISGYISFGEKSSFQSLNGSISLDVEDLTLKVNCQNRHVNWAKCKWRQVSIEPFSILGEVTDGKVEVKEPIEVKIENLKSIANTTGELLARRVIMFRGLSQCRWCGNRR